MGSSSDSSEIMTMLEALKWRYHGNDFEFLKELNLFGLLRGSKGQDLLRSAWGKALNNTFKTRVSSYMVKMVIDLLEIITITCVAKI